MDNGLVIKYTENGQAKKLNQEQTECEQGSQVAVQTGEFTITVTVYVYAFWCIKLCSTMAGISFQYIHFSTYPSVNRWFYLFLRTSLIVSVCRKAKQRKLLYIDNDNQWYGQAAESV